MKVIYEPAKPRYHVQCQDPGGEWEYWHGYATAAEAIIEADHMTSRDSDNYRVVDSLQDDDPSAQFLPATITREQFDQAAKAVRESEWFGTGYEQAYAALTTLGISVEGENE